jgi:hypothetical protein
MTTTTTTTTTAGVPAAAASRGGFPYAAAEWRARDLGLQVVSVTAADLPAGCSSRDGYGNRVIARTAWLGFADGQQLSDCAYGVCCQTIHQVVNPGVAEGLRAIAEALQAYETFGSREAHFSYYRPCCRGAHELDQLTASWREIEACAIRALRVLPVGLVAWLLTVPV